MPHDQLDSAYATLGLRRGTPLSAVRRRYRALVRKWHPDRFAADPQGVAEATLMLKAVNHAYGAVLGAHRAVSAQGSAIVSAAEPRAVPARVETGDFVAGSLTPAQKDETVAAILHSQSLLAIAFDDDVAGWRSRAASSAVALLYVAAAWRTGGSVRVVSFCVLPLLCIWFPDVLGEHVGFRITKPSPPAFVWFFGWVLLLVPLIALGIVWLRAR
ncbi:MAG: J domain-containing protein [Betaproteobacteria bacterium]